MSAQQGTQVTVNDLLQIIGAKEVDLYVARQNLTQLQMVLNTERAEAKAKAEAEKSK